MPNIARTYTAKRMEELFLLYSFPHFFTFSELITLLLCKLCSSLWSGTMVSRQKKYSFGGPTFSSFTVHQSSSLFSQPQWCSHGISFPIFVTHLVFLEFLLVVKSFYTPKEFTCSAFGCLLLLCVVLLFPLSHNPWLCLYFASNVLVLMFVQLLLVCLGLPISSLLCSLLLP